MAAALPTFMVIKKLLLLCPTQSFDVMHRKMICNQKCMLSNLPNFPYYMSVVVQSLGFTFSSLASHPSSSQLYLSWNKSCFFSVPCLYSCDFVIAVFLLCMNYTTTQWLKIAQNVSLSIFQFWPFSPIFALLKLAGLVTLFSGSFSFSKSSQIDHFWHFQWIFDT